MFLSRGMHSKHEEYAKCTRVTRLMSEQPGRSVSDRVAVYLLIGLPLASSVVYFLTENVWQKHNARMKGLRVSFDVMLRRPDLNICAEISRRREYLNQLA